MDKLITSLDIQRIYEITHQAASKGLKTVPYTLIKMEGSDKPVKGYEIEALPLKWREKMEKHFRGREESENDERQSIQRSRSGEYEGSGQDIRRVGWQKGGGRSNSSLGKNEARAGVYKRGVKQACGLDHNPRNKRQPTLCDDNIPILESESKPTAKDKAAIIAYLKASMHQNAAIEQLNKEYSELSLTKQKACRWKKEFRARGIEGLEDGRGRSEGDTKANITLVKQAIYASGAAHTSSGFHVYCLFCARQNGLNFDPYAPKADISESSFRRIVERLKKDDKQIGAFLRVGKDGVKDLYPSLPRRWNRVNQEWQVDATPLDFFVTKDSEKVRPMVVAIVDCYSGARVWGLYDSATSLSDVRLLKKAIESFGVPELIRGDNGADYLSAHFQGVLAALGIAYHAAQAGKGRQKGKIERSFGSVQHSWLENLPGFIGHNVKERSAIEAQEVEKLKKLHGAKTNVKCLSWETMQAVLDDYLAAKMEASGAAKKYRLARERGEIKTIENLHRHLGKSVRPTVSAKGAQAFGRVYGGYEFWMSVYIGQKVTLREDIDDVSRAYIFDRNGEYICEGIDATHVSISAEEAKEILARHKARYISPAQKMIKASKEAKDYEYEELARVIAGEIKEKGKAKLQEKLRDTNKTAANVVSKVEVEVEKEEEAKPLIKPYRPSIQEAIDALAG